MKLWLKLTIILTILINLIIQVGLLILKPKIEKFSEELLGDKLKSIAASIAASIDGNEFSQINIYDSSSLTTPIYKHIHQTIKLAEKNLQLHNNQYLISILDKNSLAFGVVLTKIQDGKDSLMQLNKEGTVAALSVYDTKKCVRTKPYYDKYGSWLSGLAPIMDKNNNVVGVVKVDQKYEQIQSIIDNINEKIFAGRIALIPITILISIILSNVFLLPITKVKNQIQRIASGNYSENKRIKSGGEIKELVDAAEMLRKTLFEQQQKIFNTISELKNAKEKAESSDKMKSEFLALISHEIRTPLNVILGNIELLKMEVQDGQLESFIDIAESVKIGSQRLIRTIEMMVLYSELASGSYNTKLQYVNLFTVINNVANEIEIEAAKKGIRLKTDCASTTNVVLADKLLLEEAVKQIADNAVKFSDSGEIIFCLMEEADYGVKVIVKDGGKGISKEFMAELFKPFRQEDMSTTRGYEGNGLGLAIAKKCCDLCEFELRIESEKGKGTTVEINIPKSKFFRTL
ncbi:ATP-binding protein [Melioribacteraceae bacterium 4301-Me]|uniref:sensor histidine kinase n=1 Tax=Pyranulibacter aquaticus TaxID=3163344 RepID=UPI003597AD2C